MGVFLSTPNTEKDVSWAENDKLFYAAASMQGWRTSMEDSHLTALDFENTYSIFGVFDGHGGKEVAHFASRHLLETLKTRPSYSTDLGAALQESFLNLDEQMRTKEGRKELRDIKQTPAQNASTANNPASKKPSGDFMEKLMDMLQESNQSPEQREGKTDYDEEDDEGPGFNSGCTAVVAAVKDGEFVLVANAGDSRAILVREKEEEGGEGEAEAVELSWDHKPHIAGERKRILAAGGVIENGRVNRDLNLTRAIGDMRYKKDKTLPAADQIISGFPELHKEARNPRDKYLVLACDGVWDVQTNQQVASYVLSSFRSRDASVPLPQFAAEVCTRLLDLCLAPDTSAMGTDNMTVVIVGFK
jgi:protein phosphatase 1G